MSIIALVLNVISCTRSKTPDTSNAFILAGKKMAFTQDRYGPNYFKFEYLGSITNNTSNIYKQAKVRMVVEFELENGQVLNDVDMAFSKNTFGAAHAFDLVQMFQPGQSYDLMYMKTEQISTDYLTYPIKSVTLSFQVEATDEINGTNEQLTIMREDITSEWRKVANGKFEQDFDEAEEASNN